MLEQVKPKTKDEEMNDLTREVGQAFFESGKLQYEIELKQAQHADLKVRIHNLNQKALKVQEAMAKEAQKEGMKVELAKAPVPEGV